MDQPLDPEEIKRLLAEDSVTPANDDSDPRSEDDAAQALNAELAKLADYRRALEQEFAGTTSTDESISEKALDAIVQLVPDAGEAVSYLLNHSTSDSVRASLARWVFDKVIRKAERDGDEDELTKLVNSLTGKTDSASE